MVKIDWHPEAARDVFSLATADQRRIVDAVQDVGLRVEQEVGLLSEREPHTMMVGGYEIRFGVSGDTVDVQGIKLRQEQA